MYRWKKSDPRMYLTKNFTSDELSCHCNFKDCIDQGVSKELMEKLERVRRALGAPIRVNSGYRCAAHQSALKSAGYETAVGVSPHQRGIAADIASFGMHQELNRLCLAEFQAVGTGKTFIHVDTRADKERRWTYVKS